MEKENLVFSHNDLLVNNILIRSEDRMAIFIDYEYSRFNYPAFDIANYFTEASYNYDVTKPPFFEILPNAQ